MNLKSLLKKIKLNESTISMLLGAVVIVVVGILIVNYFRGLDNGNTIPAIETESTENKLPTIHTVAEGEDLWSISEEYYGSGYNWVDIAESNSLASPGNIVVGQELTIPDVEPKLVGKGIQDEEKTDEVMEEESQTPSPTLAMEKEEETKDEVMTESKDEEMQTSTTHEEQDIKQEISGDTYTVVQGDTLWDIAVRAYGDGYKWVEIARANDLANPNVIHTGNVFVLPR